MAESQITSYWKYDPLTSPEANTHFSKDIYTHNHFQVIVQISFNIYAYLLYIL